MNKTRNSVLTILRENNIEFDDKAVNEVGIEINKNTFVRVLDAIREHSEYSSIRGHVKVNERFNVSYETKYLSYERWTDELYLGQANISYANVSGFRLYVSSSDWIDLHIKYDDESYATVVIVPSNK